MSVSNDKYNIALKRCEQLDGTLEHVKRQRDEALIHRESFHYQVFNMTALLTQVKAVCMNRDMMMEAKINTILEILK